MENSINQTDILLISKTAEKKIMLNSNIYTCSNVGTVINFFAIFNAVVHKVANEVALILNPCYYWLYLDNISN